MRKIKTMLLAAAAAGALLMTGCTTAQIEQTAATVEADIQAATAAACGIVPTVTSIFNVVGAVTGTTVITSLAASALAAVEADICSAAPTTAARLRALPLRSQVPATIGKTAHGVAVSGWRASN